MNSDDKIRELEVELKHHESMMIRLSAKNIELKAQLEGREKLIKQLSETIDALEGK